METLEDWFARLRLLPALDLVVAAWTIAWVVIGLLVASEIQGLSELSDTVGTVGGAAVTSGEAIGALSDLVPVVGGALEAPAEEIQEAGRSAQESGEASRTSVNTVSVLLGLSIAVIPSVPVLAAYLPGRISRARETNAVEEARRRAGDDPLFREFLARRALNSLTYRELAEVSREPWRDIEEGRFDRLASAELKRLGLSPESQPRAR